MYILAATRAVPMCQRWQIAPPAPLKSRPVQDRIRGSVDALTCPDQGGARSKILWMELFSTNPLELHIYIFTYIIPIKVGWTNIPSCQFTHWFSPKIPPVDLSGWFHRIDGRNIPSWRLRSAGNEPRKIFFIALQKTGRNNGTCGRIALEAWHFPNSGLIWWGSFGTWVPRRRPAEMDSKPWPPSILFFSSRKIPKKIKNPRATMKASPVLCGREV